MQNVLTKPHDKCVLWVNQIEDSKRIVYHNGCLLLDSKNWLQISSVVGLTHLIKIKPNLTRVFEQSEKSNEKTACWVFVLQRVGQVLIYLVQQT